MNVHDNRGDFLRWADRGGTIPWRLAEHCRSCPACAAKVRQVEDLHASMTLLTRRPLPQTMYADAARASVRFLRRAVRAKAEANAVLAAAPTLSLWRRLCLYTSSAGLTIAAAVLVLFARFTLPPTLEKTTEWGERLADHHWKTHIDPNGDLLA